MKISKMVRATTVITLLTATVMNAYIHYRTNESYNKLRVSISDLKNRMYELRAVTNAISRQTSAVRHESHSCEIKESKNDTVKYKIINRDGMLGIYNAEDKLVGRRIINAALPDSKVNALKRGITVSGETELDRLLEGLVCEEETAII